MNEPHILLASGNVWRLKRNLSGILDRRALIALEHEISRNVVQLYRLAVSHKSFAMRADKRLWRQRISRLYYAAYTGSRAIRLQVFGDYSTDSSDHKKVAALPDDFPNRLIFVNELPMLREDRNLSDYDHEARREDLSKSVDDWLDFVNNFMFNVKVYLRGRGVHL